MGSKFLQLLIVFNCVILICAKSATICNRKLLNDDPTRLVCVCNSRVDCGTLDTRVPQIRGDVKIYQSSRAGKRFEIQELLPANSSFKPTRTIRVLLNQTDQTILGWGGAFSDTTGYNVVRLPNRLQRKVLESFFGAEGARFDMGRVPIGGTDQSTRFYSYDDLPRGQVDVELKNWRLAYEDLALKIPLIRRAMRLVEGRGLEMKLFSSPWSPPIWMKDSKSPFQGHLVRNSSYYRAYANYFVKFFKAYEKYDINFFATTIQNQPTTSTDTSLVMNTLNFYADEMKSFIGDYLGPALERAGYSKENHFNLLISDDNLRYIDPNVLDLLSDPKVYRYISGYAYHFYGDYQENGAYFRDLQTLRKDYKSSLKYFIMSEACEKITSGSDERLGAWYRGERFARDIIFGLNNGINSWTKWSMVVNMRDGGPTWVDNGIEAPVMVSKDFNEYYKLASYYAIAHFSRFMAAGSKRVVTRPLNQFYDTEIQQAAVVDVEQKILILTILNSSEKTSITKVNLVHASSDTIEVGSVKLDPRSITTILVKL